MEFENIEKRENIRITLPPIELILTNETDIHSIWSITSGEEGFLDQIKKRKELIHNFNVVISKIPKPDMSLDEALQTNLISETEISELYESLSILLENDDYSRLIFYIPFELFPAQKFFSIDKISESAKKFSTRYMKSWYSLLGTQDVRANFVDGDVLEFEMRSNDLPRVVKAAHLIPELVKHDMLKIGEVLKLLERESDEILKNSIADTLPVLYDLGFITNKELEYLGSLGYDFIDEIVNEIKYNNKDTEEKSEPTSLEYLLENIDSEFKRIDSTVYKKPITEKRMKWLKQRDEEVLSDSISDDICFLITEKNLEIKERLFFETNNKTKKILLEGIRKSIEKLSFTNQGLARNIYEKYKLILFLLWENNDVETKELLLKLFRRIYRLNIIDDKELSNLNITVPDLSLPFSQNLKSIQTETEDLKMVINTMQKDPVLSEYTYPVVIIYGSRLKGYGSETSDLDTAIIIKPNTPKYKQEEIRHRLKSIFNTEKFGENITEFWLSNDEKGNLSIDNFDKYDIRIGEKSWVHVLFGGVWEGDETVISELRKKLLTPYFNDSNEIIHGKSAHKLYTEEMERDMLQYRLMHKGYERFYPSYNKTQKLHSKRIDGSSMFWDSGYRRVATKIFCSRVFIPKISSNK